MEDLDAYLEIFLRERQIEVDPIRHLKHWDGMAMWANCLLSH